MTLGLEVRTWQPSGAAFRVLHVEKQRSYTTLATAVGKRS